MGSEIDRTVDSFAEIAFAGDAQFSKIGKNAIPPAPKAAMEKALRDWGIDPSFVEDEDYCRVTFDAGKGFFT
jgi:hypothetical protein